MTQAVIHWYEELNSSIMSIEDVPHDARFEGAITKVPWVNGKDYNAKIYKISSDKDELRNSNQELRALNAKLLQEREKVKPGSKRKRTATRSSTTASEREVAAALGERVKLPKQLEAAKKTSAARGKAVLAAQEAVTQKQDAALLSAGKTKRKTKKQTLDLADDDEFSNFEESDDDDDDEGNDDDDISHILDISAASPEKIQSQSSSPILSKIADLRNPNTEHFLATLSLIFSSSRSHAEESSAAMSSNKMVAKSIIKEGDAEVPLREGYALTISKSLKAKLLLKAKTTLQNPVRLLKRLLEFLYGKEQIVKMSVCGSRAYLGLETDDLLAIYAFLNKHSKTPIEWETMIKEMTKKFTYERQKGKVSSADKTHQSAAKVAGVCSPSSSNKVSSADKTHRSPAKQLSTPVKRNTPGKAQSTSKNFQVTDLHSSDTSVDVPRRALAFDDIPATNSTPTPQTHPPSVQPKSQPVPPYHLSHQSQQPYPPYHYYHHHHQQQQQQQTHHSPPGYQQTHEQYTYNYQPPPYHQQYDYSQYPYNSPAPSTDSQLTQL